MAEEGVRERRVLLREWERVNGGREGVLIGHRCIIRDYHL